MLLAVAEQIRGGTGYLKPFSRFSSSRTTLPKGRFKA
jgi:hypothetical protein